MTATSTDQYSYLWSEFPKLQPHTFKQYVLFVWGSSYRTTPKKHLRWLRRNFKLYRKSIDAI